MKLSESSCKKYVVFSGETIREKKHFKNFPGFVVRGVKHIAPAKPNVVYNLASRMPKYIRSNLSVTPFTKSLLQKQIKLDKLPDDFTFHTKPLRHQEIALRYCYTTGHLGLLLDPGLGKTKIALDFIWLMKFKKTVVVCPKALLFVWEEEALVHRPELSTHIVGTTNWEKEKDAVNSSDVVVLNYAKAVLLEKELASVGFSFIVLDEALIKDYKTNRTKAMLRLSKRIPHRGLCSGTLVNNSVTDIYAPVKFLEPALVGNNYKTFQYHFTKVKLATKEGPGGTERKIPVASWDVNREEARDILRSCCIVMSKDEWLDLPPKIFKDRYVSLSAEQQRVYKELASNYITTFQGMVVEVSNPLSLMTKLAQIAGGFLYADENAQDLDELFSPDKPTKKVKRKILYFDSNPKLDDFDYLMKHDFKDRKFILWYNMEGEYQILSKYLKDSGTSFLTIKGGEKRTGEKVKEFNENENIQVLLAQAKTVNYGITVLGMTPEKAEKLQRAIPDLSASVYTHYFYGLGFSLEVYLQQQDRSHRIGVVQSPEYYRGLTNSPVETRTVDSLERKQELRKDVLVDIINSLDLEKAFS